MVGNRLSRRLVCGLALVLPWVVAGCGGPSEPQRFEPLSWDYLTPLKLNVAAIDMGSSWVPTAGAREKGYLAPTPPVDALRRMAEDRLVAAGTSGRAVFVIDDASIVQERANYVGHFAVHLDVLTSDGTRSGYAEARVARTRTIGDDDPAGARAELYDLVRQMMSDMNVEFEYQVRRSLRDYLQTTSPVAPEPGPVEQEELVPPGAPAPAPAAPALPPAAAAPSRPSAVPFSSPAPTPLTR